MNLSNILKGKTMILWSTLFKVLLIFSISYYVINFRDNMCKRLVKWNLTYPAASLVVKGSGHKDCPGHILHGKRSTEISPGDFVPDP